uniref:7TM_GPCR_Srx domain-containing protein n=1 Tax=Heterorhabditis bacteriophora TaxID=37862 RepID=A0A1I7WJC5_HETBA
MYCKLDRSLLYISYIILGTRIVKTTLMYCFRTIIQYSLFTFSCLFLLRYFLTSKRSVNNVREKNWKKDTVYLYQLGRTKVMPGISYGVVVFIFISGSNGISLNALIDVSFIIGTQSLFGLGLVVQMNNLQFIVMKRQKIIKDSRFLSCQFLPPGVF